MSDTFIEMEKAIPEDDLGPELAIFDGTGVLAASYRTHRNIIKVWIYNRVQSGLIEQYLVLNSENVARLVCESVATARGAVIESHAPDLDAMLRNILQ